MKPYYNNDQWKIYLGDAKDVLDELRQRDLLLTDPPYGITKSWKKTYFGRNGKASLRDGTTPNWDHKIIDGRLMNTVLGAGSRRVLWGGNFYPLPPSRCWLVWDKLQSNRGADCELAWSNLDLPPKVFRMSRIDAYHNKARFKKVHPAEKPFPLALWCINLTTPKSVIDPFCGTGNFIAAAKAFGVPAVGIDSEEKFCEEATKRLDKIKAGEANDYYLKEGSKHG